MGFFNRNNNNSNAGYDANESPLNARLFGRKNNDQQTSSYTYAEQETTYYCNSCRCYLVSPCEIHQANVENDTQKRGWFSRG